jgi:endogenous inhibitor of DNA gyrase (YacG/DUF329 family)
MKCKTDGMINVVDKKCPCGNRPIYNVPGETRPICCATCKTVDMIDVVHKRCRCGNRPSYGIKGESPMCCLKCKTVDMIDVVNKKCPCGTIPNFNVPGETKGIRCLKCKTDDMINVMHKRCPCGNRPIYNVPGETKGIRCLKCKTDDMINVISKICPGYNGECPVRTYVSRGHEYCMSCDPNDARRKQYKRFEEEFFAYVKDKLDIHKREFRVSFNQKETSKKYARLDGVIFGDGVVVCLEVDENGHQEYECDEHRMHLVTAELLQNYPGHIVSWVRVNPTTDEKTQTSKKSQKIREKRFEEVVTIVENILKTHDTRVMYVGFD